MKWHSVLLVSTLLSFTGPVAALANGATASFPAGGVVFKHNRDVSIEREDLEIGLERIHVHYVFRSSAAHPLHLTIGFPMAKVVLDDGPDELGSRSASKSDPRDYMAFTVRANGKIVRPKLHEYAWKSDANVTARLRALRVPVFAVFNGRDFGLQKLARSTRNALIRAGLADRYGDDPTVYPLWEYQSVYEWRQTFHPGRNVVDISYVPLYGDETTEGKYSMFPGNGDARYCYDGTVKARFKALQDKGAYFEPLTLGYILKTARNWNGPIGTLNLKIDNPDGYLFSFCVPGGLKAAGKANWTARNFVPGSDLDIVFLYRETDQ